MVIKISINKGSSILQAATFCFLASITILQAEVKTYHDTVQVDCNIIILVTRVQLYNCKMNLSSINKILNLQFSVLFGIRKLNVLRRQHNNGVLCIKTSSNMASWYLFLHFSLDDIPTVLQYTSVHLLQIIIRYYHPHVHHLII